MIFYMKFKSRQNSSSVEVRTVVTSWVGIFSCKGQERNFLDAGNFLNLGLSETVHACVYFQCSWNYMCASPMKETETMRMGNSEQEHYCGQA